MVRVGRPPLDLILALAGASRRRYECALLDGMAIELFPEERT